MSLLVEIISALGLIAANGIMIVFVVVFGKVYCNYSYAFSWSLSLYGTLFFYVSFLCRYRRLNPFIPVHDHRRAEAFGVLHRQAFFNGLVWSLNYVCLLTANSFVSGLDQVVINESNLVMVFAASMVLLGNRYHVSQWICVLIVFLGGIMPMINGGDTNSNIGWCVLYVIGAWAIGFANTITENIMRNYYVEGEGDSATEPKGKLFLIPATQYLCLTNFYGIFCVPALFWVSWMATGGKFLPYWANGMACLWTGSCYVEDNADCPSADDFGDSKDAVGLASMWVSSTLSFVSALIAARIQRNKDAVYVTIAYTLAPVLSMVLFLIPIKGVYDTPTTWAVVSNVVTLSGGVAYKAFCVSLEPKKPVQSALTQRFRFAPVPEQLCTV